ncbi:MAG: EAL domain-containing protein [Pseudomonadota bacterium]|nr:EAL domain-containing protein [Pseudomonadota bacterium]
MATSRDLNNTLEQVLNSGASAEVIGHLLRTARERLRMEVGFISEFIDGMRVFRFVDSAPGVNLIAPGGADFLARSYCQRIVDERAPQLISDARTCSAVVDLKATQLLPVGAHISVPITLSDGHVFGTFCLFSRYAVPGLNHRSLALVRAFAEMVALLLEERRMAGAEYEQNNTAIHHVSTFFTEHRVSFSPSSIVDLNTKEEIGTELVPAISQPSPLFSNPFLLLREADRLGLSQLSGVAMMESSLAALTRLSADQFVSMNVTPQLIMQFDFNQWLRSDCSRLVLGLSEHDIVDDYTSLKARLYRLKESGVRIAVVHAGAGFASMRHILQLQPEFVKLDADLTCGIHKDKGQQAMLEALMRFCRSQGSILMAEGICSDEDEAYLRTAGVGFAQFDSTSQ